MVALVLCDGFDKYGPPANLNFPGNCVGDWSAVGTTIVAGLSSLGYAVSLGSASQTLTSGNFPVALTRVVGSARFLVGNVSVGAASGGTIGLQNGGTRAFSIYLNPAPLSAITLYTGTTAGTIIASGGSISLGSIHVVSWDITIGASAAYAIYLDGVLLFSGTGNTGNGQTSVNNIMMVGLTSGYLVIDDLAVFNPADPNYNSGVLTQSIVVETQFPNSDNQRQFTYDGNVVWPAGITPNGIYSPGNVFALVANAIYLQRITPVVNCTINSISIFTTTGVATANFRMVIYADSAGAPAALLSSGNQVTGTVAGSVFTGTLVTPQSLIAGTNYWIGFINDSSVNLRQSDNTTNLSRTKSNTYTSGPPSPAGTGFSGSNTIQMWGNCTGATTDWSSEMLNPPLGPQSQVHSSTVGQEDLYGFPALLTPGVTSVYGSVVKGFVSKSDTGVRTVSFNMKSGATDSTGSSPGQALATSGQWQRSTFDLDPATGTAWTVSGFNAAVSGITLAS